MYVNDIIKPSGSNASGVSNWFYWAPKTWFSTIAMPTETPTDPGQSIEITDNHIFTPASPAKGFVKIYTTQGSGELKFNWSGPLDSKGVTTTFEAKSPGINTALWELLSESEEGIGLVQDLNCQDTTYFQIGTSCLGSLVGDSEFTTGKGRGEGEKTTTIKLEGYSDRPLVYRGAVSLAIQP